MLRIPHTLPRATYFFGATGVMVSRLRARRRSRIGPEQQGARGHDFALRFGRTRD